MSMLTSGSLSIRHAVGGPLSTFRTRYALRFASSTQSSKIRAASFALEPNVALDRFDAIAADKRLSLICMIPFYWPTWRVDAILEKEKVEEDGQIKEGRAYLAVQNAYLPGVAFGALSQISYASTDIPDELPLYDHRIHASQLEGRVKVDTAFRYTVSPFAAMKEMRRAFAAFTAAGAPPILDEARWEEKMLACYPIYMPIYIAICSYKNDDGKVRNSRIVMEAHHSSVENCRQSFIHRPATDDLGTNAFLPKSKLITFAPCAFETSESSPKNGPDPDELYTSWLAPSPRIGGKSPLDQAKGRITWNDPRIQDWSGDERKGNAMYIRMASNVQQAAKMVERLVNDLEHGAEGWLDVALLDASIALLGGKSQGRTPKQVQVEPGVKEFLVKSAEKKLCNMERELLEMKPAWLVEREAAKPGSEK